MAPDLEKLRRFALAAGLVLITYILAGIQLEQEAKVAPLGIPFTIKRPELVPIGLVLASLFGMLRFYYYGFMLSKSPAKVRGEKLAELGYKPGYRLDPAWIEQPHEQEQHELAKALEVFPQMPGTALDFERKRLKGKLYDPYLRDFVDQRETDGWTAYVGLAVPRRLRLAARLHDIDYSAPVWVNAAALGLWVISLYRHLPPSG